jgi:hypothetical protein
MLSPHLAQLVQEVSAHFGERKRKLAERDPEACLVSLLTTIKERLPEVSATLSLTLQAGLYDEDVEKARKLLEQQQPSTV